MNLLLGLISFILFCSTIVVLLLYFKAASELSTLTEEHEEFRRKAKASLARYKSISDLEQHKDSLRKEIQKNQALLPKVKTVADLEINRQFLEGQNQELQAEFEDLRGRYEKGKEIYNHLTQKIGLLEDAAEMQEFGLYRPHYNFDDAKRYKLALDDVRRRQKELIKDDFAAHCPTEWTVNDSKAEGKKMIKAQVKLMLRAFNGECDAIMVKVKYNNVDRMENRINKAFEQINKTGESKQVWITNDYLNLKLQELHLVHEHNVKIQEEKETQRQIREQMREEEKAQREYEKAIKQAEADEKRKLEALELARQELLQAHEDQQEKLKQAIEQLEADLSVALQNKERAIAQAQLTRAGHVYVISNIGSFGEDVYKIGMTRRLEPLDRVHELGSASVPFVFDVHAMIYSEDAPTLERSLHEKFEDRRVNMVNSRKEYFRVSLDEIQVAVEELFGQFEFVEFAEASEYRQTMSLLEQVVGKQQSENEFAAF